MKQPKWIMSIVATLICSFAIEIHADQLNNALDTRVTLRLEDVALADVLQSFAEQYDINIVLDNRVVAPAGAAVAKPYVTDGKVGYLKRTDFPLRDVLTALLRPLNLSWVIQQNYVWVTTPQNIRHEAFEDLETRVYELPGEKVPDVNADVRTRSPEEVDTVALVRRVIPVLVEPVSGRELSYMRFNLETKQLVVHNTPKNHQKLEQLLDLIDIES